MEEEDGPVSMETELCVSTIGGLGDTSGLIMVYKRSVNFSDLIVVPASSIDQNLSRSGSSHVARCMEAILN